MKPEGGLRYREEQRFHAIFTYGTPVAVLLTMAVLVVLQGILGRHADSPPLLAWVVVFGSVLAMTVAVGAMKLVTEVRSAGLYVRLRPLPFKKIELEGVSRHAVVTYSPMREYGGWGIRIRPKGRAYNARGNRGVRIDYANGRHILIGSQEPEKLNAAIGSLMNQHGAAARSAGKSSSRGSRGDVRD
jgi:hypothetical protein